MRFCKYCNRHQEETAFARYAQYHLDGTALLRAKCKECSNNAQRFWYAENKDRVRLSPAQIKDRNLRKYYGLTLEAFNAMAEGQNFCCAICQQKTPLCVDHDHSTGAVRALLCQRCNKGLGCFLDSPAAMRAAAVYIEKHQGKV